MINWLSRAAHFWIISTGIVWTFIFLKHNDSLSAIFLMTLNFLYIFKHQEEIFEFRVLK